MTPENKNAEVYLSNGRLAGRLKTLIPLLTIAAVAALAVGLAFVLFHGMPQQTVAMAVYPEGTLNAELAKRYREILARDGLDLMLVPSVGAVESVARLRDPKSGVSVALIPGGITTEQDSPELIVRCCRWCRNCLSRSTSQLGCFDLELWPGIGPFRPRKQRYWRA